MPHEHQKGAPHMADELNIVVIEIGGKNHLSEGILRKMALGPAMTHARYPEAKIALSIGGYDDDPRELWQIPEAVEYIRRFTAQAGLRDWHSSLFRALDELTIGLLVMCDAVDKPHPYVVAPGGSA